MARQQLAVTFEENIPVAGQILILDAADFLYSLGVLREIGWGSHVQQLGDWTRFVATAPGKLLAPENLLRVHSAFSASPVTEVIDGIDKGVELLKKLVDRLRQLRATGVAGEKLRVVREELLPLIEKLKKLGMPDDRIQPLLDKALTYADEVLTELTVQGRVRLK